MTRPELSWYSEANRYRFVLLAALLVGCIATLDWRVHANVGLGFLYLLPILVASGFLPRFQIMLMAVICALLREQFSSFPKDLSEIPRVANVAVGFAATGLLIREMAESRRAEMRHVRQMRKQYEMREEVRQQLVALMETSSAAVIIIDEAGKIALENQASRKMFESERSLVGRAVGDFLPVLNVGLLGPNSAIRTNLECRGNTERGRGFMASVWLSTYKTTNGVRAAAIVLDTSEQVRDREKLAVEDMLRNSRIVVAAVSHEIRNITAAVSVLHANLGRIPDLAGNKDFEALGGLVEALRMQAGEKLQKRASGEPELLRLDPVLEDCEIIVRSIAEENEVELSWKVKRDLPLVRAERHGLLQVLLNLVQNSCRVLQGRERREIEFSTEVGANVVRIAVRDTGPGVSAPASLFIPFSEHADLTGLGLYVSRAMLRNFGGELRYEGTAEGSRFVLELPRVAAAEGAGQ